MEKQKINVITKNKICSIIKSTGCKNLRQDGYIAIQEMVREFTTELLEKGKTEKNSTTRIELKKLLDALFKEDRFQFVFVKEVLGIEENIW